MRNIFLFIICVIMTFVAVYEIYTSGWFGVYAKTDKQLRVSASGEQTYNIETYWWYRGDIVRSNYMEHVTKEKIDSYIEWTEVEAKKANNAINQNK